MNTGCNAAKRTNLTLFQCWRGLRSRSHQEEILDREGYESAHLQKREMDRLSRQWGIYKFHISQIGPIVSRVYSLTRRPVRVLDVGCGYGGLALSLQSWSQVKNIPILYCGLDSQPGFI